MVQYVSSQQLTVASRDIVVVEDDEDIGSMLQDLLQTETMHQVVWVRSGSQAHEMLQMRRPHLIILDYQLPDMTGLALYDRLHYENALQATQVMFLSANLPHQELMERQLIGIEKPFDLEELLHTIEQLTQASVATGHGMYFSAPYATEQVSYSF